MDTNVEIISIEDSDTISTTTIVRIPVDDASVQENQGDSDSKNSGITLSSESNIPSFLYQAMTKQNVRTINNIHVSTNTKVSKWLTENYRTMVKIQPNPYLRYIQMLQSDAQVAMIRRDYKKPGVPRKSYQPSDYSDSVEIVCSHHSEASITPKSKDRNENLVVQNEVEPSEALSNNDMQKKIELCEYLKLMDKKPPLTATKSNVDLAQNRRSSRVKNLALRNRSLKDADVYNGIQPMKSIYCNSVSKTVGDRDSEDLQDHAKRSVSVDPLLMKPFNHTTSKFGMPTKALSIGEIPRTRKAETYSFRNIESLQVPEVTSTSIPSSICQKPELTTSLCTINQNSPTNKTQDCFDESQQPTNTHSLRKVSKRKSVSKPSDSCTYTTHLSDDTTSNSQTVAKSLTKKRNIKPQIKNRVRLRRRQNRNINTKSKSIVKKKHFSNPKLLNRLRSSGKLKMLPLKSILYGSRKKVTKRKLFNKVKEPPQVKCKSFVSVELIQGRSKPGGSKLHNPHDSDSLFNGLTPEHYLCMIQRQEFIDSELRSSIQVEISDCKGFNSNEIENSARDLETIKLVVENMQERVQNCSRYSVEDLEVSQLMENPVAKCRPEASVQRCSTVEDLQCSSTYLQSELLSSSYDEDDDNDDSDSSQTSDESEHDDDADYDGRQEIVSISQVERNLCECQEIIVTKENEKKTLEECISKPIVKHKDTTSKQYADQTGSHHIVSISEENCETIGAYYVDFNLVIVQKLMVSFWKQTPLGNVLGAQDMWIPNGNTGRLILEKGCIRNESRDVIINLDDSIAYIELWTKEHKSDKRERPVADVFVVVYFATRGTCIKKVLQLENIQGFACDVRYIVFHNSRNIIVSWSVMNDDVSSTKIHCYELSPDYQTVQCMRAVEPVTHYLSSLHNIEDCNIVMGCGDQKVTIWNFENLDCCYILTTMDLLDDNLLHTVYAKSDRGFIFTLNEQINGLLQLVAVNSIKSTWKCLRSFKRHHKGERLIGVCIENNLLVACYERHVVCWNAVNGDLLVESSYDGKLFLSYESHFVIVLKEKVLVRKALEYIISMHSEVPSNN